MKMSSSRPARRRTGEQSVRLSAMLIGCLLSPALMAASLTSVVETFLHEQISPASGKVEITAYPPSAQFPPCPDPVAFLPGSGGQLLGRVSVGIRCADEHDSIRYLSADISVIGNWPTVATRIMAGTEITADMLTTASGNLSRLPATAIRDPESVIGKVTRRALMPGQPIRSHDIQARPVVERGQEVVIESGGAGFVVRRQGQAMEAGALGESIRVQLDRRNTLHATVTASGKVRVQ